jgi:hypothetical protein
MITNMKYPKTTFMTAKTIKEYKTSFKGIQVVVPIGSKVSNKTALGNDDNYRYWLDFAKTYPKGTLVNHDLVYYGLNIPAEYCEPYQAEIL